MNPHPVTLTGAVVHLVPLTAAHAPALARVGLAPAIWRWIPTAVTTEAEMHAYVGAALDEQRRGVALPFAIVEAAGGQVIGSTRFGAIDVGNRRLEIGWTWLAPSHQRTAANTAAKRLLLGHAFEALGTMRVEFKTDALNEISRNAILRLGASQEGLFRKHVLCASGRVRDTVYFSIIDTEWPGVRAHLDARLAESANPTDRPGLS